MAMAFGYTLLKDFQENRMTAPRNQNQMRAFQTLVGYQFRNAHRLSEALTHSSAVQSGAVQSDDAHNERLEFLGDRVLGLVIADELLKRQPDAPEGALARALNALVRKEACVVVARQIGLGDMLHMDAAEARAGGRDKKGMLGDACEALIAAIYLDGGMDAARAFILGQWAEQLNSAADVQPDAKSALQEWAHAKLAVTPAYKTIAREGPDHGPIFTVEVRTGDLAPCKGTGRSKRDAEQAAAETMLRRESVWS